MNRSENALWLCTLIISILSLSINSNLIDLVIYWSIIILCIGNAKRLHSNKYIHASTIIRRSMYILPLLLPLIIEVKFPETNTSLIWISVGLVVGILFILPKITTWRIVLSDDYVSLVTKKENRFYYFMGTYTLIGCAIAEELFFRYYIMNMFEGTEHILLGIFLSSFLFMVLHYGTKWSSKFTKFDLSLQLIFGLVSASMYVFSGSIVPSLIAHITYNSPHIIQNIKSILFTYKNNESKTELGA